MTRQQLASELFDLFQRQRDQIQTLLLEQSVTAREAGGALRALTDRAERVVEGYVASMDSGRVFVRD